MDGAYNKTIIEHFYNPRNVGELDDADAVGEAGNTNTGDIMRIYIRFDQGRIVAVKHKTFGNAVAIAASSMASLMILNKTADEALTVTREDISVALDGIPPEKMVCSNMAPDAIRAALADYSRND